MADISQRVLFVDDEPNVLTGLQRQLRHDFEITTAPSGDEGLQRLREDGPFAVVVSDYKMVGMNGVEFLRRVRRIATDTVTVLLTGFADVEIAMAAVNEGCVFRLLSKPCPRDRLRQTVQDCLEQYRMVVSQRLLSQEITHVNDELRTFNHELEQRVTERTTQIRRLYQFVNELNGLESVEEIARAVVVTTADLLAAQRVILLLPDETREYLAVAHAVGIEAASGAELRIPVRSALAAGTDDARPVIVVDGDAARVYSQHYGEALFAHPPTVMVRLVARQQTVGLLNVAQRNGPAFFDEDSLALLKAISESAATAIQNNLRLRERNEARDVVILALAKAAEHRDPETGTHLERVQTYCRLLCETLAHQPKYTATIDRDFIDAIVRSSPLHDIGKIGIPDRILLKPGKLTPEEYEVMKTHTRIGAKTIRALLRPGLQQSFLRMGLDIAEAHHEKYDGSGYPNGLAGEEIPLSARILALADVYDALTSKRVYKPAFSHEQAAEIIYKENGKHFAPDVVQAFTEQATEFERVAREWRDDPADEKFVAEEAEAVGAGRSTTS
jgi:response regulator RpfG family c-di-GMP phosphodiesterase